MNQIFKSFFLYSVYDEVGIKSDHITQVLFLRDMEKACIRQIHRNIFVFQDKSPDILQSRFIQKRDLQNVSLQPDQEIGLDFRIKIQEMHRFCNYRPACIKNTLVSFEKIQNLRVVFVGIVKERDQRTGIKNCVLHEWTLSAFSCS